MSESWFACIPAVAGDEQVTWSEGIAEAYCGQAFACHSESVFLSIVPKLQHASCRDIVGVTCFLWRRSFLRFLEVFIRL